jgi:hypothetical protein
VSTCRSAFADHHLPGRRHRPRDHSRRRLP